MNAQEDEISPSNWDYLIQPYLLFPNMSGETAIGDLPAIDVDADIGDIFGHLKFGAMLYLEATNNTWTVSTDLIYMHLNQEVKKGDFITDGEANMKQFVAELAGLRRVSPWLEAGIGARLVSLNVDLDFETVLSTRNAETSETWVDPVIIARSNGNFNEDWLYMLRFDFGGFGIGSDFTWQLQADIGYNFSETFYTSLGYRFMSIDYNKGNGSDLFVYDIDTYGAVLKFGINL